MEYYGFNIINTGPNAIVPGGGPMSRKFSFFSQGASQQDALVEITEIGTQDPGYSDSAWVMVEDLIFLPRLKLPSLSSGSTSDGNPSLTVTLPNGEKVNFDPTTKQIIGGVLIETAPLDQNPNRFKRHFPSLEYRGQQVMIHSEMRGTSPSNAFELDKKTPHYVTAVWKGQTCKKIRAADIWTQVSLEDGGGDMALTSDAEFAQLLKSKCGWSVDFSQAKSP